MLVRLTFSLSVILIITITTFPLSSSLTPDGFSLLALKAAIDSDPTHVLDSWSDSDPTPCHWPGIVCSRNRVTTLFLPNKSFSGYLPSELGFINSLRRLTLSHNNFSNTIPSHLFNATTLLILDLSHNSLSGPIPPQIASLKTLRHLDLSSNSLNGSLPSSLSDLQNLTGTLNLSFNKFSGGVPASYGNFPVMVNLDLRHNNLTGEIPQVGSLLNQGPTAFSGNPSLCGFPLETPCPEAQNPNVFKSPEEPPRKPEKPNPSFKKDGTPNSVRVVSVVSVAVVCVISVSVLVSVFVFRRKWKGSGGEAKMGREKLEEYDEGFRSNFEEEEGQKGKFVVVDEEGFNLELEDLLRASAYVVGKSRSGIVYKVVSGRGSNAAVPTVVVAVRRLSEAADATWRFKEFESEVEAIGRVQHPNIVRLRAYYYANDEKLLVSDYIRNGSLYTALYGNHSLPCSL